MVKDNAARTYALIGCLLVLFTGFSTYLLHVKVGLDHNKQLRFTQIVAADTAWAGKKLVEFAHEIDEEFMEIGEELGAGLGFGLDSGSAGSGDLKAVFEPAPTTTVSASSHVTTNGPLRVAPGIVWVVPAFKRSWTLKLVLESLKRAGAGDSTVIVSQDADDTQVRDVATEFLKSGDLPRLRLVSHPWSCSRHPDSFPGNDPTLNEGYKGDTYGNPRSAWATCLKHHWWWLVNYVWSSGADTICLLEDDIVIQPGTLEWLAAHSAAMDHDFGIKLTTDKIAVPWCMGRKVWERVHAAANDFCTFDDYNWDQTLAWLTAPASRHGRKKSEARPLAAYGKVVAPKTALSMHVGSCEGWDSGGRDSKCTPAAIVKAEQAAIKWMERGNVEAAISSGEKTVQWLHSHGKPNGGWGHPRDHQHCLEVAANVSKSMDEQYVGLCYCGRCCVVNFHQTNTGRLRVVDTASKSSVSKPNVSGRAWRKCKSASATSSTQKR